MKSAIGLIAIPVAVVALCAAFAAQAQSRGELLYAMHCTGCHSTQMHWRDRRAAGDWAGILFQVERWQGANSLAWSDADILSVAHYLNATFYHYESPRPTSGRIEIDARRSVAAAGPGLVPPSRP